MKILVTGSSGLVGTQVVKDLVQQNHDVISCYHEKKAEYGTLEKLDLNEPTQIVNILKKHKPECIIHLGAMTGVDLCESEPQIAKNINSLATKILGKEASKLGSFFLYVSTDYVFDGTKSFSKENDAPNPLSVYGQSKLEGENALNDMAFSYCVARISSPFGLHKSKKSFPLWIKENLDSKKEIPVVVDQFTSPTYVPNLSKMLIEITTKQISGIIHVSGATRISRYEFAELIAQKLDLDKKLLKPVNMNEINWKAKRPFDSSLDVSLATEILNEKPQKLEQSIELLVEQLNSSAKF